MKKQVKIREALGEDVHLETTISPHIIKELERMTELREIEYEMNRQRSTRLLAVWAALTAVITFIVAERGDLAKESPFALATITLLVTAVLTQVVVDFLFTRRELRRHHRDNRKE